MTKLKSLIKCAAFVLAAVFCISGALSILVPKNYTGEWQSPVTTYCGFYELKKDTADVLFLGSSHVYTSFCPQVLYDEYGITSYNLSMGNQNLIMTYYWLKEALLSQSPSAVVVEGAFAFERSRNPSNSTETYTQKSVNYMHWSRNRIEAIKALCEIDPKNYSWELFVPFMRYHDRWTELHEEDFTLGEIALRGRLMGFSGNFRYYCGIEDYQPYDTTDGLRESAGEEMVPAMEEYLNRIVDLCRERNIRLILALTPSANATLPMHIALQKYSDEHKVEFLDFNTEEMIREMEYEFAILNEDKEHPNIWGAQKITHKFGEYLTKVRNNAGDPSQSEDEAGYIITSLQPHKDEQWENARISYEEALRDAELVHTDNIYEYLPAIKDERYSVLISVKGESSSAADEEIARDLQALGLKEDIRELAGDSYYAVIDAGRVLREERRHEELISNGVIRDGKTFYKIDSKGSVADELTYGYSSIVIDDKECSINGRGINIAVVDNESAAVIDKVCFHTGVSLKAERER